MTTGSGATATLLLAALCSIAHLPQTPQAALSVSKPGTDPANANVDENLPVGTIVTVDADGTADNLEVTGGTPDTWSITAGTGCITNFQVQMNTGNTRRATLKLLAVQDYETTTTYTCTITVTDTGASDTVSFDVTISINNKIDVVPDFTAASYACTINEGDPIGTVLPAGCQATYTDVEVASSGDVVYCSVSGTHSSYFAVDHVTSSKLCNPKIKAIVDADTLGTNTLNFNVEATDSAGLKSSRLVTVTVNSVNEHTPVCSPTFFSVTKTETFIGEILSSLSCTDADSGTDGNIEYSLMDAYSASHFAVDASSGRVTNVAQLDYDSATRSNYTTLVLKVSDKGASPRSTSVTISISIVSENDNSPAWAAFTPAYVDATTAITTISENGAAGLATFTASATDADFGSDGTVTYSIQSARGSDLSNLVNVFEINAVSGLVTVKTQGVLNRETISYADITVLANDNPSSGAAVTITRVVRVAISDANEFPPRFVPPSGVYSTSVAEGATVGTEVQKVDVSDPDASAAAVSCTIVSGNTANMFRTKATDSKIIEVQTVIEPDAPTNHPITSYLTLTCTDGGLTSTATVTVSVAVSNDNTPSLTLPAGNAITLPENQALGKVADVTPADGDGGSAGTFTCGVSPPGVFILSGACDELHLVQMLDREATASYSLKLTIQDNGSPQKSSTVDVTVTVSDVNDNSPICAPSTYYATVSETSGAVASLTTLACSDADTHGIYYSSNTTGFAVDANTGVVSYTGGADYDTGPSSYDVIVYAVDKNDANKFAKATVRVTITNVNEFTPTFTDKAVTVTEPIYGGQLVTSFVAADADKTPDSIQTYRIVSGDASNFFSINSNGDLFLQSGRTLDYETLKPSGSTTFTLVVEAKDGGSTVKSGSGSLTITVQDANDNAPIFSQSSYSGTVAEGSATVANVLTVAATDADADPTNSFATVRFSFPTPSTFFSVDATTGIVSKTAANLDHNTNPTVTIPVVAIDNAGAGPHTATSTIVITVTDTNTPPTCTLATHTVTNVREDTALGTSVWSLTSPTVICSDADTAQSLTYSLSATSDNHFAIHPTTGSLVVTKSLNAENTTTHYLQVLATDNHATPASAAITVQVQVLDVNEFSPNCTAPTSASLNEGASSATVYTVASCSDADAATETLAYQVQGSVPFTVAADGSVSNSATLDYESGTTSYVVQVTVTDDSPTLGGLRTSTYTTTVTVVPVNENPPVFSTPATIYAQIQEDAAVSTSLTLTLGSGGSGGAATIAATDSDTGNTSHSSVIYSIASGNANGWFSIDPSSGVIATAATLDRETSATATLTVSARDAAGMAATSTVTVLVTITDVNDNSPVFHTTHFTFNVSEGVAAPSDLIDFSSAIYLTDADAGANAAMTVAIASGMSAVPNDEFQISGKKLQTKKTFSLSSDSPQYVLKVTAIDGGLPKFTATATVTVNIVEANLAAPAFVVGAAKIDVPETTAIGTRLYDVTANDTDVGLSGTITYSLGGTSPSTTLFTVDATNGDVFLQNAIDYDTLANKVYEVFVVATDSGSPAKSNTFTLTVNVTDANDNDPVFAASNEFAKTFAENVASGFDVTTVVWTDADTGAGGSVTCGITAQTTPPAIFSIDANTCKITTNAIPDRETRAVHSVEVQLSDGGLPSRTKKATFTFTLTDVNDNAPVFDVPEIVTSVVENLAAGAAVSTVSARDIDLGTNADFEFSLLSNDGAGDHTNFQIGATTGVITTAAVLDREVKDFYSLRVLAIDKGATPLTGTAVVNVTVTDVNDNTPTWVGAPYTATVSEGASIGTLVKTVSATDLDSTFGVLTYSITAGDTLGLFRIDSSTGRVETAKNSGLDRESVGIWNLTLRVEDNGSPTPNAAASWLYVYVTDINEFAPSWVSTSATFNIIENSVVGTPVGTVVATDNDAGPTNNKINYAIDAFLEGDTNFAINAATAQISVSVAALDRETRDTYRLRIVAWDSAVPSKTATNCLTVTISITDANDHDPAYSQSYYNATVLESAAVGYNVLTVSGSDADTGVNALLQYAINTSDSAGALADGFFNLNSATGLLTVKSGLDRETHTFFHFPIIIYDSGTTPQRSSSASVYIVVEDVNDVAPVLSSSFYNAEVPQVDDGNMQIVTISASDPDSGTGGSVQYFWNSNTPYFHVDASTGVVTRNTLNSVESYRIYTQDVAARDQGSPQLTSATSKVRIDTFPAEQYIVMIHFSMSEADYLSNLATIKTNLAKTLVGKYPDNRVGQWKYHMYGGNVVGYFYALANTLTDNATYISVDKEFVPYTDLLAFWRFDSLGTPTAVLKGSDFTATPVVKVEPYPQAAATPWYQTWWGILLLTLASLAALALCAAAVYGLYVCISALCAAKPPALPPTQTVKPPPIQERQILELNKDKHPRHHPKPKGRYLIKESQGQNRGAQQASNNNRSNTPRAEFDRSQQPRNNNGRVSPTGSFSGDGNLDF